MKLKVKIKKIIFSTLLILVLVFSTPLAVFAGEATPAPEASSAPEASPVPASPAPEASSAPEASPAPEAVADTNDQSPEDINSSNSQEQNNYQYNHDNNNDEEEDEDEDEDRDGENNSGNVGNTQISTGDATAGGAVITNANNTTTSTSPNCSACLEDISVTNLGNGANSDNSANVNSDNSSSVTVNNDADIDNNLSIEANSGGNTASYNVGSSEIETGDANGSGSVLITGHE